MKGMQIDWAQPFFGVVLGHKKKRCGAFTWPPEKNSFHHMQAQRATTCCHPSQLKCGPRQAQATHSLTVPTRRSAANTVSVSSRPFPIVSLCLCPIPQPGAHIHTRQAARRRGNVHLGRSLIPSSPLAQSVCHPPPLLLLLLRLANEPSDGRPRSRPENPTQRLQAAPICNAGIVPFRTHSVSSRRAVRGWGYGRPFMILVTKW